MMYVLCDEVRMSAYTHATHTHTHANIRTCTCTRDTHTHTQALDGRASTNDVRVGDMVCVRIDSLYTPYGDMQVSKQMPELPKPLL